MSKPPNRALGPDVVITSTMARSLSKPGPCRCSIGPPPDTLSDRCMQVAIDFSLAATTDPCHAAPCPTAACKSQSISASRLPPILFMEHASRNQLPANRFQHRGYPRSISCSTLPGRCMQVAIGFSIAAPPSYFVHCRAASGCGGKCAPVEVIPDLTGAMTYIHSADPLTHTIQPKQESRKKAKTLKECSWAGGLGKQATQSGRITCCTPKPHHMKLGGAHIARLVTRRRRSTPLTLNTKLLSLSLTRQTILAYASASVQFACTMLRGLRSLA